MRSVGSIIQVRRVLLEGDDASAENTSPFVAFGQLAPSACILDTVVTGGRVICSSPKRLATSKSGVDAEFTQTDGQFAPF